jgi:Flp pilus assembly protein TadD
MLNALGVALMQKGDDEHAMQIFEKCVRLAPNFALPVLNMATLYLAGGKADKAHEVLAEFLKRDPENKEIQEALKEVDSRR